MSCNTSLTETTSQGQLKDVKKQVSFVIITYLGSQPKSEQQKSISVAGSLVRVYFIIKADG